jgi:hypothetical protein
MPSRVPWPRGLHRKLPGELKYYFYLFRHLPIYLIEGIYLVYPPRTGLKKSLYPIHRIEYNLYKFVSLNAHPIIIVLIYTAHIGLKLQQWATTVIVVKFSNNIEDKIPYLG